MGKSQTNFSFRPKKSSEHCLLGLLMALLLIMSFSFPASAQSDQEKEVSGVVYDSDGIPMAGVFVLAEGTSSGTTTDYDGKFTFTVPAGATVLKFSYLGMKEQTVTIAAKSFFKIYMESDAIALDDIVVVGYGSQKKETVTGAISVVETADLLQSPQANISNALVGRMPGLLSVQNSGAPGEDAATIRIRGIGTFADGGGMYDPAAPLIIVDGIETDTYNNIDPNEIETISILKDASATAVYGVRGANGVIIITTRRGEESAPVVSLSSSVAMSRFTQMRELMGSYEWAEAYNRAALNDAYVTGAIYPDEYPIFSYSDLQRYYYKSDPLFYPDVDWIDTLFRTWAPQTQHNLNVQGGTSRVKYFVSLGYFYQEGLFRNNIVEGYNNQMIYQRYNIRANFDFQVTKRLSVNVNISDQIEDKRGPRDDTGYMLIRAFAAPPNLAPGIVDGKVTNIEGRITNHQNPLQAFLDNPRSKKYSNYLNGSIRANYDFGWITEGLSAHATVSYQNFNNHNQETWKALRVYNVVHDANGGPALIPQAEDQPYTYGESFGKSRKVYIEAGFDYNRTFGNHTVTALVLYNQSKYYDPALAYGIPNAYQGIVGRVTYNYKQKYLAEVNVGYNGTENFDVGKRFGLFPAFSLGYVISEEDFFPENNAVTFLKIRGSYGEVGNDKIGGDRFLYLPSAYIFDSGLPKYYFGIPGQSYNLYTSSSEGKIGNPDVTWERARKVNVGLEANFWDSRISFKGDYFYEYRDNILTSMNTTPDIVAANLPAYNLGKMQNQGFDGEITFNDRIGQDFHYWIRGMFTFARNKVLEMDEVNHPYEYQTATGHRLGQYFGLVAEGFYNTREEVNDPNRPVSAWNSNKLQPGDVKYRDVNGDGKIDNFDMVPMGYSAFPEISYGISFGFDWKGLDFSVLFQGSGNQTYRASKKSSRGWQEGGSAVTYLNDYSWTREKYENGEEIRFPRLSADSSQSHNYIDSSLWLENASYLRLKNVEIGYTFKENPNRKFIKSARIYINGTNLYTWHNLFPGEDPEIPSFDDGGHEPYPTTMTLNLGVNIKF